MTLEEALGNKLFDLPYEPISYFPNFISKNLSDYLKILQDIDDEYSNIIAEHLPNIKQTVENINSIVDLVFCGKTASAYSIFSNLIQNLEIHLLVPNKDVQLPITNYLFKARKSFQKDFSLLSMFHVPFEKRYSITTSRFSLPGVPCLYLANSIFTCWEELDRPFFQQMAVSRFEINGGYLPFLDLKNDARKLKKISSNTITFSSEIEVAAKSSMKKLIPLTLPRFINKFPLLMASYVRVHDKEALFKPEYIFPQMIMQWLLTKDDIRGVEYISTKFQNSRFSLPNLEEPTNFAIPVKSYKEKGYCDVISETLSLTEPISWEVITLVEPAKFSNVIDIKKDILGNRNPPPILYINLIGEEPSQYWNTAFGKLEHELFQMPLYKFSEHVKS